MKQLLNRAAAPTPPFFKKIRNIGLVIAGIGASILAAPVALPAFLTTIAGYLALTGSILSGVSQLVNKNEEGNGSETDQNPL